MVEDTVKRMDDVGHLDWLRSDHQIVLILLVLADPLRLIRIGLAHLLLVSSLCLSGLIP